MRKLYWLTLALTISGSAAAQTSPPTARDTLLSRRIWVACDSMSLWRQGQQQAWYKRQVAICKANADSVKMIAPQAPNRPPAASFIYPVGGCEAGKVCTFTSTSTDDRGVASFKWNCVTGSPPCSGSTGQTASTVFSVGGSYDVTLTVKDADSLSSTITRSVPVVGAIIPPPDTGTTPPTGDSLVFELPRSVPAPTFAKATRVFALNATTSDLQAVVNAALPGDSITLTGDFPAVKLPNKPCGAGISITGTAPALAIGARQTPTTKTGRIVSASSEGTLQFASPTCQWKIDGIEIVGASPVTVVNYGIVGIGDGGKDANGLPSQVTLDKVPSNIVLSHLYIHGTSTTNTTRCVVLQSASTVVRDSYISECHAKGMDSQAIEGWNGPGPFLIENNYLEGAGENIMFGGAAPGIYGLIPSDITIRRNHFFKPRAWQGVWTIKNLLEFKAANRVLVEKNVFQDIWPSGQEGFSIVVKSNQGAETDPNSLPYGTTNVTIQGNLIDTAAIAIDVHAKDCYPTCPSITTAKVLIRGNYARNIGLPNEGRAAGMLLTGALKDIVVVGNSFYHHPSVTNTRGSGVTMDNAGQRAQRLTFTNNYFEGGAYQVFHSGGKVGTAALDSMSSVGNWTFSGNAVVYGTASKFPTGNTFPTASVPTSSVGANISAVLAGVSGVVIAQPPSFARRARPRVRPPIITARDTVRLRSDPSDPTKPSYTRKAPVHWPR